MADETSNVTATAPVDQAVSDASAADNAAPVESAASVESVMDTQAASAPQGFDYEAFARANAETLRPVLQQFAPKPPPTPNAWDDPNKYWTLPNGPEANQMFHQKLEQIIEARTAAALEKFEQKVGQALQGRDAYFRQTFAVDPNFARLQSHFDRYVSQGVPAEHAKRLAALDAGMIGNAPQAHRPMPAPPKHLTTQAGRSGGVPAPKGQVDFRNEKVREARFNAIADKLGWEN